MPPNASIARIVLRLLVVALAAVAARPATARAATEAGGRIVVDTAWRRADSPILVTRTVVIGGGATLRIEPGVVVWFVPDVGIEVAPDPQQGGPPFGPEGTAGIAGTGGLVAHGEPDAPIVFTAAPLDGDPARPWGGIRFGQRAFDAVLDDEGRWLAGSGLEHCVVELAGAPAWQARAIRVVGCRVLLRDTIVRDSRGGVELLYAAGPHGPSSPPPALVERCRFVRNRIDGFTEGGGLRLLGGAGHRVVGCTFVENEAPEGGGAIIGGDDILVSDCVFAGNRSSFVGAGLFVYGAEVTVRRVQAIGNGFADGTMMGRGGGIAVAATNGPIVIEDSLVLGNEAAEGGGVRIVAGGGAVLRGNRIEGNRALLYGPGVLVEGDDVRIERNRIADNEGDGLQVRGGGLYLAGDRAVVSGNRLAGNRAGEGGAILVLGDDAVIAGNRITGNRALAGPGVVAGGGGGVSIAGDRAVMRGNLIEANHSVAAGGGLRIGPFAMDAQLRGNRIVDNEADVLGGGIAWQSASGSLAGAEGRAAEANEIVGNRSLLGAALVYDAGPTAVLDARWVCWGTTDRAEIDARILDGADAAGYGVVFVDPILEDPDCGAAFACPADLDGDGRVGSADLAILLEAWGDARPTGTGRVFDLDRDGAVGPSDLSILLAAWGDCG